MDFADGLLIALIVWTEVSNKRDRKRKCSCGRTERLSFRYYPDYIDGRKRYFACRYCARKEPIEKQIEEANEKVDYLEQRIIGDRTELLIALGMWLVIKIVFFFGYR